MAYAEHLECRRHGMLFPEMEMGFTKKSSAKRAKCRQAGRLARSTTGSISKAAAQSNTSHPSPHSPRTIICLQPASQTERLPVVKGQRPSRLWRFRRFQVSRQEIFMNQIWALPFSGSLSSRTRNDHVLLPLLSAPQSSQNLCSGVPHRARR